MSMYENERNLEGIKTRIEKDLDRDRTLLNAWKNVSFPTKKDGTPFSVMSKNFSGATYRRNEYAIQPGENELHLAGRSDTTSAYYDDSLSMYASVQKSDLDKVEKKENLLAASSPYLCSVYSYDLDDAKNAIAGRIAYYEKQVADNEKALEEVGKAYDTFLKSFEKALADLSKVTSNIHLADLVEGTICNNYPYCKTK